MRKVNFSLRIFMLIMVSHSYFSVAVGDQWRDLTTLLPQSANAILAIDANALFDSPMATKNRWRESHASHFDVTPTMLPPEAERFVLSAEVDIEHFEPKWEFATMALNRDISTNEIRNRLNGEAELLAGLPAVRTDRGNYIVPFQGQRIAVVRLAQRQWASQQLRRARDRQSVQLPRFLGSAVDDVADGHWQIAVAIMLENAVPPAEIRAAIERSTVLQKSSETVDQLTREMNSLEGALLRIRVTDTIHGSLELVFREDPEGLSNAAKPFLVDLLSGAGALLPEFREWRATSRRNRLGIEGPMTTTGLRRILSILSVESVDVDPFGSKRPVVQPTVSDNVEARTTEKYVRRIKKLVDDISSGAKAHNVREQLLWTDRSARTIARMSTRSVNPAVAEKGREISCDLRRIVSNFHYAADNARARSSAVNRPPVELHEQLVPYSSYKTPYGRFYRYAPFSYARINIRQNVVRSRQITAEELSRANDEAKAILSKVEGKVAEMEKLLSVNNYSSSR